MVHDRIENLKKYYELHPLFQKVDEFLKDNKFEDLELGKHEILGKDLFVIIESCQGRGKAGARLEAHRKYIDIQFCFEGEDIIGIKHLDKCQNNTVSYKEMNDIAFYGDEPDDWLSISGDRYAIFFPEDAHAPLACTGMIKKAVFKIAKDPSNC